MLIQFGYKLRQSIFIKVAKPSDSEEITLSLSTHSLFDLASVLYLATIKHLEREEIPSSKVTA